MTKNDYITRAQKTAMVFAKYLDEVGYKENSNKWTKSACFIAATTRFNREKKRKIIVNTCGATRNVIITSDYVIKMDKVITSSWGTSKDEYRAYEKLVEMGMDYLVVPITQFEYGNYTFYIMPRCSGIGKHVVKDFPENDFAFIDDHFDDIHTNNIGKFHKRVVLIDYAMNYL